METKTNFTAGQWSLDPRCDTRVVGPEDRGICSTGSYNNNIDPPEKIDAENRANARLIAASPALYKALQAVADDEMWMDLTRSSKDKVEAALRLATEGGAQ